MWRPADIIQTILQRSTKPGEIMGRVSRAQRREVLLIPVDDVAYSLACPGDQTAVRNVKGRLWGPLSGLRGINMKARISGADLIQP